MRGPVVWLAACIALLSVISAQAQYWEGTATRYTYEGWGGDEGKCGYEKLSGRFPTGRYFAAWPDNDGSMCGKCLEVSCAPRPVTNLFGERYTHTVDQCRDPNKKIILLITDSCPCNGNAKWCCGGNNHLDMSHEAFKALAKEMGIMSINYRVVDCPGKEGNTCKSGQKQIKAWQKCGGAWGYSQDVCCPPYHKCTQRTPFWYQCLVDPSANWNDGSGGNGYSSGSVTGDSVDTSSTRRKRRIGRRVPPKAVVKRNPPKAPKKAPKSSKKPAPSKGGCKRIQKWGQCGGIGGPTGNRKNGRDGLWKGYCCATGYCKRQNNWFWQCA